MATISVALAAPTSAVKRVPAVSALPSAQLCNARKLVLQDSSCFAGLAYRINKKHGAFEAGLLAGRMLDRCCMHVARCLGLQHIYYHGHHSRGG
jgi:hypothetical protein